MFLIDIGLEVHNKVIAENDVLLRFIPDCYKNQNKCDEAADKYSHA